MSNFIKESKENLSRTAKALGREMTFFGSKDRDLVLQTKGRIKINYGDKFTELFNGSDFSFGSKVVRKTKGRPDNKKPDGFYFDESTGTLYLKIGDQVFEIFSGAESTDGYIIYNDSQDLTKEERDQALKNLGLYFESEEEALNSGFEGIIYIEGKGAFLLENGVLTPLVSTDSNKEETEENGYYFDNTVTIEPSVDLALLIKGLNKILQLGVEGNQTNIYQTNNGLVIDADKGIEIKVNDKTIITSDGDTIDFELLFKALAGIITDEIYSSNFKKGDPAIGGGSGWGLWIDKTTGESYLQVDHIYTESFNEPYFLRYYDALKLAVNGEVTQGKVYVIIDFQNEWEVTPNDDLMGTGKVNSTFYPPSDSIDPSKYEEDEIYPKYGVDRNVRPIMITGKNSNEYEDVATYWYLEDNKDIVDMRYDIRVQNYPEGGFTEEDPECENKGRIYYMKDIWNNEGPVDFKHYWEDDGNGGKKYIFTSPTGTDLSSENTEDNLVCVNNILYDLGTKISEELHPIIITGKLINNNEFRGLFNECTLGDPESIIENNDFRGNNDHINFVGTIQNNDFRSNLTNVVFEDQVVGNVFNRDVSDTTFHGEVNNNTFNVEILNSEFQQVISNQIMGIMENCVFNGNMHDNQFTFNEFLNNTANGEVFSNVMNVQTVQNCTWEDDFNSNQITAELWDRNEFGGVLTFNMFQANVVQLRAEGYISNCQFLGRIENVSFSNGNGNTAYGVNNNIIDGYFADSNIQVDFSHNHITGPITGLNVTGNRTSYLEDYAMFNFNIITAESFNNVTISHDFQHNKISTRVFGELTINGIFCYNSMEYANMRIGTYNGDITYCRGKGDEFTGTLDASFKNCQFQSLMNCVFRPLEIKDAIFRHDFEGQNFDTDTTIQDLERLYNDDHQVDVFFHNNEKIVVACQVCNSSMRGEIKMWFPDTGGIPDGWHICDGTEGTPDLTDRFIRAGNTTGPSDDSDSMDYPLIINLQGISVGAPCEAGSMTASLVNGGSSEDIEIKLPRYYRLIFIMKL